MIYGLPHIVQFVQKDRNGAKRIPLLRVLIRSKCCIIWAVFVSDVSYLENMCFLEVDIFCDNPHGKDVDLDYNSAKCTFSDIGAYISTATPLPFNA